MKASIVILICTFLTSTAFSSIQSVTCKAAPSNESLTLNLSLRPGTSSYEGKAKFKDSSYEFTVMSRPTGLTLATGMGDTVIMADSQNSLTGTTIALVSLSNPANSLKVSCKLN